MLCCVFPILQKLLEICELHADKCWIFLPQELQRDGFVNLNISVSACGSIYFSWKLCLIVNYITIYHTQQGRLAIAYCCELPISDCLRLDLLEAFFPVLCLILIHFTKLYIYVKHIFWSISWFKLFYPQIFSAFLSWNETYKGIICFVHFYDSFSSRILSIWWMVSK